MSGQVCVIGYKTSLSPGTAFIYGHSFDKASFCCDDFRNWFNGTEKPMKAEDGINLSSRGGNQVVLLRTSSPHKEKEIHFCPFCRAKIEIKESKVVKLKNRYKQISDGYDEELVRESEIV